VGSSASATRRALSSAQSASGMLGVRAAWARAGSRGWRASSARLLRPHPSSAPRQSTRDHAFPGALERPVAGPAGAALLGPPRARGAMARPSRSPSPLSHTCLRSPARQPKMRGARRRGSSQSLRRLCAAGRRCVAAAHSAVHA
jgi:hypothetical protein